MQDLPQWFVPAVAAVFGAAIGSFANVVIHRLPTGGSISHPASACPGCGHALHWWENIPILSFLALRGRCRSCRMKISIRYPMVEAGVAILWASIASRFTFGLELVAFVSFVSVLVMLSAIDAEHRRIPNSILAVGSLIGATLLLAAAIPSRWDDLVGAAVGALIFGIPMLAIGLVVPKGMGMGDIKLSAYLGFHLGWISLPTVAVGAFLGFLSGAVTGVLMVLVGRKGRKDSLPFGPFLSLGAIASVLWGRHLVRLWLG